MELACVAEEGKVETEVDVVVLLVGLVVDEEATDRAVVDFGVVRAEVMLRCVLAWVVAFVVAA